MWLGLGGLGCMKCLGRGLGRVGRRGWRLWIGGRGRWWGSLGSVLVG